MKYIDTHSHLYSDKFSADRPKVIARAQEVLEAVFLPNIDLDSVESMLALNHQYPQFFFPMMGLHPSHVKEGFESVLEKMKLLLDDPSQTYYGIGETGIDLYWDKTTLPLQQASLEIQIAWAKAYGLPIILHAREAIDETYKVIAKHHDESLSGIFHCFDGTVEQAAKIRELGTFKLGIGGIVTYRKKFPEVVRQIGLDLLVLETDSPYLAPKPFRGKRNESSYTLYIAEKIGEIFDIPQTEVADISNHNAREIFVTAPLPV
ncbi:MAG: TatD family hydrolase [Bacteroidota bacterium]